MKTSVNYATDANGDPVAWRLFGDQHGTAWNGLITGGIGSGKTVALLQLASASRDAGYPVHAVASSGRQWLMDSRRPAIDFFIDPSGMTELVDARKKTVLVVDEAHIEWDSGKNADAWTSAARSPDVALILTTTTVFSPNGNTWAGHIYDSAMAGNLLALRSERREDPFARIGFMEGPYDLTDLKHGEGYAYHGAHDGPSLTPVTVDHPRLPL